MSCNRITRDHAGTDCPDCGNCTWHCKCDPGLNEDAPRRSVAHTCHWPGCPKEVPPRMWG